MALRPTKGMLTSGPSYPTKGLPGETDPFDPNARTTSFRQGDPTGAYRDNEQERYIVPDILMRLLQGIGQSEIGTIWADPSIEEILLANSIKMNPEAPLDLSVLLDSPEAASQVFAVIQESLTEAQEIADVLSSGDITSLEDMEAPSGLTTTFLEQGAMQFAGGPVSTATPPGRDETLVITGGAGVTIDIENILGNAGKEGGESLEDILDAIVPYIPGVSLPNWMPTAGVIFLPTVGEAINKVNEIAGDIGNAIEEGGSLGEILSTIGTIIVGAGGDAVEQVQEQINKVISQVTGAIANPTQAGTIIGGVLAGSFPSGIPDWLGGILSENIGSAVYGAARNVLVNSGTATETQLPPVTTETPEQDPTLMFTNRGNNYFVSSEGDEYFQLAESEDLDFELNGQYTREQLDNTGLETIGSGTYQSLIDDLSFHALEEDIYQYSLEDLRTRYEEEGGIIPGDWKEMDDESKYGFLLDDYFEIPTQVSDPDRGEPPTEPEPPVTVPEPEPEPPIDQPEPEPEPPVDQPEPDPEPDPEPQPEPEPSRSDIEGLFADFLEQLDTEFTGQQDQINTIINNFVETLPDFDAMPTMADIAEYFEINGVTLSQQNFDRIREELSNAGYLTQEQLTEALQGVATPEQVQQAIEGAGFATPEQVIQALAEAGYATPDDITTALSNSGFVTEDRMLQALAEAGYATPEQVEQIVNNAVANIVIPEGATTEEVRQLIQEAIDGIPEGISLGDVGNLINDAISNIDFPPNLSGDDVRGIVDSFGFATTENVQDIVNTAIANIQFPEGATTEEVRQLIQSALNGLPEGISLEDIGGIVNEAIANIQFPEGLSEGDVRGIVDSFGFATSADVQTGFDNLNDKLDSAVNGLSVQLTEQEAEFLAGLTGVEASVLQQLAATEGGLRSELETLGFDLTEFQSDVAGRFDQFEDTFAAFQTDVSSQFSDLNDRFDDALDGIATQFSDQEAEFLASVTGLEASLIQSLASVEGGLSAELEMLDQDLVSLREDVAGRFDEFRSFTSEQFEFAAEERQNLQQAIIAANGDITQLSADMQQQFANFGGTITELFAGVGVDINALQAGQITQQEALEQLRTSISQQFTTAQEDRQELQQAIIAVNGDVTQLSDDMMLRFQQQDQSIEDLFAGTNVNIEALRQGQISQQEAFDAYQDYTTTQLGQAQQERLNLAQEIIGVGGQVEALSADSQQRFAELGLSLADLQEEFSVNLIGLQQGQVSQAEAFGQFRDSVTTRLGLGEQEREEILTRQTEFERTYGEQQEELQEQITAGNIGLLSAMGSGFAGIGGGAPEPAPFKEFMKGITYRPREAPQLAIKTPAVDYNEEAQQLLMRTRRRGMLV